MDLVYLMNENGCSLFEARRVCAYFMGSCGINSDVLTARDGLRRLTFVRKVNPSMSGACVHILWVMRNKICRSHDRRRTLLFLTNEHGREPDDVRYVRAYFMGRAE